MQLSTPAFFVFFLLVWLLYWASTRSHAARLGILLAANLYFLARFGLFHLALPAAASIDFLIGRSLARPDGTILRRRVLLAASLLLNLGLLLIPKVLSLRASAGGGWLLALSLSFYCFQSLTYTIDLYRRDADAAPAAGYLAYLASSLFFPVLVAGPILRLHALLKQVAAPPALTDAQAGRALLLIGIGLVKKLMIADFLGQNLVARVFDTPTLYSGLEVLAAVYGYALQLFFDFSGYTDIVLGVGLLLGFSLPENFRQPYLSLNLIDFWQRWHITFSQWLRDYLMESLPQRRRSRPLLSYSYSVLVTMMLGGLWHGLGWTFLIWGALHGAALAAVRIWRQAPALKRRRTRSKSLLGPHPAAILAGKIAATLATFNFVCLTWIFFNASSVSNALSLLSRLGSNTWTADNLTLPIAAVLVLAAIAHCLPLRWLDWSATLTGRAPFWLQGAALAGLVVLIQALSGRSATPFVYGNF